MRDFKTKMFRLWLATLIGLRLFMNIKANNEGEAKRKLSKN